MTTVSHHQLGTATEPGRTWVLVVAATGWAVVTTVAVLLATGTWAIGPGAGEEPSRTRTPGPNSGSTTPAGATAPIGTATGAEAALARIPRQFAPGDR